MSLTSDKTAPNFFQHIQPVCVLQCIGEKGWRWEGVRRGRGGWGGGGRRTVLLSNTDENPAAGFRRTPPLGNRIYRLLGSGGGGGQRTPSCAQRNPFHSVPSNSGAAGEATCACSPVTVHGHTPSPNFRLDSETGAGAAPVPRNWRSYADGCAPVSVAEERLLENMNGTR